MESAQSGTPDTSHASVPIRPFPRNRAGRPVSSIALPATSPQPAPPAATTTCNPTTGSASGKSALSPATHPSRQHPKLLDRLRGPVDTRETTRREAAYADPQKTTYENTLTENRATHWQPSAERWDCRTRAIR
jgi:hypothetical protein